jgi:hypothetical protein
MLAALAAPPDVELRSNSFLLFVVVDASGAVIPTFSLEDVLSSTTSETANVEPVAAVAAKYFQKRPSSAGWEGIGAVSFVIGV